VPEQGQSARHRFCPGCGAAAVARASFCGECGCSLVNAAVTGDDPRFVDCPNCKTTAAATDSRCSKCGRSLSKRLYHDHRNVDVHTTAVSEALVPMDEQPEQHQTSSDELQQEPPIANHDRICYNCGEASTGDEVRCLKCSRTLPKPAAELGRASVVFPGPEEVAGPPSPVYVRRKTFNERYVHFAKRATWVWVVLFIFGLIIEAGTNSPTDTSTAGNTTSFEWLVLFGMVVVWLIWMPALLVFVSHRIRDAFAAANVASQPIPSPAEIGWQLSQEWGRPATVQEVAAVQQMLINEKNQALITAGITFGALYMMDRNLHGR
jgi:hypothetical protein